MCEGETIYGLPDLRIYEFADHKFVTLSFPSYQFDPISKRIFDVTSFDARNFEIFAHWYSCRA